MSHIAQMAREEAARAESEPEPEPTSEPEPEPEPEPSPEDEPPEVIAGDPFPQQKVENAINAQRRKLAGILGEDGVAAECVMCGGLGFAPDYPPEGTRFTVAVEEGHFHLLFQPPLGYKRDPGTVRCDYCDGRGMTDTDSEHPDWKLRSCTVCGGKGFKDVPLEGNIVPQPPAWQYQVTPTIGYGTAPPNGGAADAWGRPVGHPHYGLDPAGVGV